MSRRMDAGERWDAGDIDRIEAVVKAGLPGRVATDFWFDISEVMRRKLERVIDKMPNKRRGS